MLNYCDKHAYEISQLYNYLTWHINIMLSALAIYTYVFWLGLMDINK